ncbi:MAG: RpoL/Rpb11 RNA polymerase subunit family protein [Candidatus Micrarchaeaceae archaeon]
MEISIVEDTGKKLVIEFSEKDLTISELLASKLSSMDGVEMAAATQQHPEISNPQLVLVAEKSNAKTLLLKAIEELQEEMDEMKKKLPKKQ